MDEQAADQPHSPPPASSSAPHSSAPRRRRTLRTLNIAAHVVIPVLLVALVWQELASIDLNQVQKLARAADTGLILLGALMAAFSLGAMACYDVIAFPTTRRLPPATRWGLGFLVFAWTNVLTLGPLGGPGLRVYLYKRRGLELGEIGRGLVRMYCGLYAGMTAWLLASLLPLGDGAQAMTLRTLAALAIAPALSLGTAGVLHWLKPGKYPTPPVWVFALLGWIGVLDWAAACASFIIIGHAVGDAAPVARQVRAILVGNYVGIASMMPGGMGTADAVWLKMLTKAGTAPSVAAAQIVLFRVCFYIGPLLVAIVAMMVLFNGRLRRALKLTRPHTPIRERMPPS